MQSLIVLTYKYKKEVRIGLNENTGICCLEVKTFKAGQMKNTKRRTNE